MVALRRSKAAFTLIELLVVISIIAVLVGILVVGLTAMRQTGAAVRCQNHLKQLVAATTVYSSDYWDFMPYTNSFSGEASGVWLGPGWLYDRALVPWWNSAPVNATIQDAQTGVLFHYLRTTKVYHCPMFEPPVQEDSVRPLTSYVMNRAVNGWNTSLPTYRVSELRSESVVFFEADETSNPGSGDWNDGNNDPTQDLSARHKQGGCLAFVDGHAEQMTLANYIQERTVMPGRLWCNPRTPHGGQSGSPPPGWTGG